MNKKQVQQGVLQNGEPLDLNKFEWNEESKMFSTTEDSLVIDFSNIDNVTIKAGSHCIITVAYNNTITVGFDCTIIAGHNNTITGGEECVLKRRDVYEVIELKENQKIKLNEWGAKGYTIIKDKEETEDDIIELNGKKYKLVD